MKKRIITIALLVVMTLGMFTTMAMAASDPLLLFDPELVGKDDYFYGRPVVSLVLLGNSGSSCDEFWNFNNMMVFADKDLKSSVKTTLNQEKSLVRLSSRVSDNSYFTFGR